MGIEKLYFLIIVILLIFLYLLHLKDLTPRAFMNVLYFKLRRSIPKPSKIIPESFIDISGNKNITLIGHRGGAPFYLFAENSLNALRFSKSLGMKIFEVDVILTKDKIPVVFHDLYLDRLTDHTGFVKDFNLKELKKIKLLDLQKISTLDEVISEFPNLIIDIDGNIHDDDAQLIIDHLYNNHYKLLKSTIYIQTNSLKNLNYIRNKPRRILYSYNTYGKKIKDIDSYKDLADFFTFNPSTIINDSLIKAIDESKCIIAVIQGDDIGEFKRIQKLGIEYIMVSNCLPYLRHKILLNKL